MRFVVILDGDNTLWDTHGAFRSAQLAMLHVMENGGLLSDPEGGLLALRRIDRMLGVAAGHLEYDFRLLVAALLMFFARGSSETDAVEEAVSSNGYIDSEELRRIGVDAFEVFTSGIRRVPPLLEDAEKLLVDLGACDAHRLLFSEGRLERVEQILTHYRLVERDLVDEVVVMPKDVAGFTHAKAQSLAHAASSQAEGTGTKIYMVGDSLYRDIVPGNEAGFITIYKPSPFWGVEVPRSPREEPNATVRDLVEVLPFIDRLEGCRPGA